MTDDEDRDALAAREVVKDQARMSWEFVKARYGDPRKWGGQLDWYDHPQDSEA